MKTRKADLAQMLITLDLLQERAEARAIGDTDRDAEIEFELEDMWEGALYATRQSRLDE